MIKEQLESNIEGSEYFKWKQALWLPQWEIYSFPIDSYVYRNIVDIAYKMDMIKKIFDREITVTSWYRPKKYNEMIGGATFSQHINGKAVDFVVDGVDPDSVRKILYPKLQLLNIRMECLPQSPWTHIDNYCDESLDLKHRYFKP